MAKVGPQIWQKDMVDVTFADEQYVAGGDKTRQTVVEENRVYVAQLSSYGKAQFYPVDRGGVASEHPKGIYAVLAFMMHYSKAIAAVTECPLKPSDRFHYKDGVVLISMPTSFSKEMHMALVHGSPRMSAPLLYVEEVGDNLKKAGSHPARATAVQVAEVMDGFVGRLRHVCMPVAEELAELRRDLFGNASVKPASLASAFDPYNPPVPMGKKVIRTVSCVQPASSPKALSMGDLHCVIGG